MPSRNCSQLSFELVDRHDRPAAIGWASRVEDLAVRQTVARMHRGETRFVLLLRTARKVMHDSVRHLVPLSR